MALGASGHDIDMDALNAASASSGPAGKHCEYFLAEWSDTETAQMENALAALLVTMGQETSTLSFEDMGKLVSQSAELFRGKDYIRDEHVTPEKIEWFKHHNKQGKNVDNPFTWIGRTVLKGEIRGQLAMMPQVPDATFDGYGHGQATTAQMEEVFDAIPICEVGQVHWTKGVTKVMKQVDMVRMWAYAKFCFEAVATMDNVD